MELEDLISLLGLLIAVFELGVKYSKTHKNQNNRPSSKK